MASSRRRRRGRRSRRRAPSPPRPPRPTPAIPDDPEKLTFKPIVYTPPVAKDYRVVLKNGMVVYIAEDPTLPLVNLDFTVRAGLFLDPKGKEGLAAFTGSQIRRGGSRSLTAEQLDEKLDFLAAERQHQHRRHRRPRDPQLPGRQLRRVAEGLHRDAARAALPGGPPGPAKEQNLQEMKKRNDESEDIEAREWNVLLYGEEHFTNRFTTEASVKAITREDLVDFHRQYFHPANMVAAVSGVVLTAGHDPEARGGLRELAGHEAHGARRFPRRSRPPRPASTASTRT